jgi:hypothetical protein
LPLKHKGLNDGLAKSQLTASSLCEQCALYTIYNIS